VPYVKIIFEDNGIGFDQRFAEKIFTVFYRLDNQNGLRGNGIGLALCKKIVQNHGGVIRAESAQGKGSRFTIILPGAGVKVLI
jgi:signal transduction histidine kinase